MDEENNTEEESGATPALEKARARLEQLENAARGVATVEMSAEQYQRRIEKLQRDLQRAWERNQRVTALKIAIQCSKLLCDPRVPQYYPSMFVLVTDILDTFGALVFDRLKSLADTEHMKMGGTGPLPGTSGRVRARARGLLRSAACCCCFSCAAPLRVFVRPWPAERNAAPRCAAPRLAATGVHADDANGAIVTHPFISYHHHACMAGATLCRRFLADGCGGRGA
jgi:hypothetical protein